MMKSIPTNYNGYTFRSRLEARAAVYFDMLGLKWDYELEGRILTGNVWYLPDFVFRSLPLWYRDGEKIKYYKTLFDLEVECKPSHEVLKNSENARKIAAYIKDRPLFIVVSRPWVQCMLLAEQDYFVGKLCWLQKEKRTIFLVDAIDDDLANSLNACAEIVASRIDFSTSPPEIMGKDIYDAAPIMLHGVLSEFYRRDEVHPSVVDAIEILKTLLNNRRRQLELPLFTSVDDAAYPATQLIDGIEGAVIRGKRIH